MNDTPAIRKLKLIEDDLELVRATVIHQFGFANESARDLLKMAISAVEEARQWLEDAGDF